LIESSGFSYETFIKTFTFISGSIYDNKKLLSVNPDYLANLVNQDEQTKSELLDKNWNVKSLDTDVYNPFAFNESFGRNIEKSFKRITADIALEGSNKFVIGYHEGRSLEDILIIPKSNGKEVVMAIRDMAEKHKTDNENILFDSDGVGGFVSGFIDGSIPFKGNGAVLPIIDTASGKIIIENYQNLKSQLAFRNGKACNDGLLSISDYVGNQMYDDKMTVRQRFNWERRAFQKAKVLRSEKLKLIEKEEMKKILNNESPDLMDMLFMNEWFELNPERDLSVYGN
jgi:hypothetical protein